MPQHEQRRGFAYQRRGHHAGTYDGLGNVVRAGPGVFVMVNYEWKVRGVHYEDEAPARLYRVFHDIEDTESEVDEDLASHRCRHV